MDSMEKWIAFNKSELEMWLDDIVPCFNHYLSITLAASTKEMDTQSHSQGSSGGLNFRFFSLRRIHKKQKEVIQVWSLFNFFQSSYMMRSKMCGVELENVVHFH